MQPDPAMFAQALMGGPETLAPALEGMAGEMGAGAPPQGPPPEGMTMGPGVAEAMGMPAEDPMAGGMGGPGQPAFASLDPMAVAQIVMQVKGLQEQDHAMLQMQQDTVLAAVMEAMGGNSVDPSLGATEGAAFGAPEAMPDEDPMGGMF